MKITVVTHYFPPEIGAPQARLSEFAAAWAEAGHEVTVLTGMPNHPTGVVPPDYRGRLTAWERTDGYEVLRTWLYATPNEGFLKKILGHLSFMVTALVFGVPRLGQSDVVMVSSPTFFSIFSAWVISRVKRARLVVEIRDLWPAIFIQLGVLRNRQLIWLLERLELAAYRVADEVVVVTEGFRDDIVRRGILAAKVHVIRNGVDLDRFRPDAPREEATRHQLGAAPGDVLVLYIGAHGISHGLTAVADAAAKVVDPSVRFAFVGEGAAKPELEQRVRSLGLRNVTMLPGVPRDEVPTILAAADICLVPLRDVPLFETFIPSKMFEYLGAGKAIVGSLRGEPAQILAEAGAVVVEPEDASAIAAAIDHLASDPGARARMAGTARRHVEREFDRRRLADVYLDVLTGEHAGENA